MFNADFILEHKDFYVPTTAQNFDSATGVHVCTVDCSSLSSIPFQTIKLRLKMFKTLTGTTCRKRVVSLPSWLELCLTICKRHVSLRLQCNCPVPNNNNYSLLSCNSQCTFVLRDKLQGMFHAQFRQQLVLQWYCIVSRSMSNSTFENTSTNILLIGQLSFEVPSGLLLKGSVR